MNPEVATETLIELSRELLSQCPSKRVAVTVCVLRYSAEERICVWAVDIGNGSHYSGATYAEALGKAVADVSHEAKKARAAALRAQAAAIESDISST